MMIFQNNNAQRYMVNREITIFLFDNHIFIFTVSLYSCKCIEMVKKRTDIKGSKESKKFLLWQRK